MPSNAPLNLRTVRKCDNITLQWDPILPTDLNGPFLHYSLIIAEIDSDSLIENDFQEILETVATSYRLNQTNTHFYYKVTVRVVNTVGEGPPATIVLALSM